MKTIKWCVLFIALLTINTAFAGSGSKTNYKHCTSYSTGYVWREEEDGLERVQECLHNNYIERLQQEQNCRANWYCSGLQVKESQIAFWTFIFACIGFCIGGLFGWHHGFHEWLDKQ